MPAAGHLISMMSMRPPPRAALITGATSGIGEAFARAMPPSTALLLTGRDEGALGSLAAEVGAGRLVETVAADLATEQGLETVSEAGQRFGLDLLVCNAGQGPFGDFLSAPESGLRDTVAVNVTAPLVLLRRLLPGMIERAEAPEAARAGAIVVASTAGFLPVPRLAAYAASKAFDLSLAEALAAELAGRPVDILALCPTATRSRFAERSGLGGNLPGAQNPAHVARRALAALGRQRTLVLGPISGSVLAVPALVRAAAAQALQTMLPRQQN